MSKTGCLIALLLAQAFLLRAQVTVELLVDQEQFLRDESLPVKVRITNRSGQTLHLGKEPDWLTFTVESRDGFTVWPREEPPVESEFELESASAATRRVDLMPYFMLSRPGRYMAVARVKLKDWEQEVVSAARSFDIIPGFKVWEQEFGVPAKSGSPEVRKFMLQQASYLKQLMLYARVADLTDTRVYRVQVLGPLVSFSRPEAQVDKESNLHVLFQTHARSFYYVVLSPHGDVLQRETHEYARTRPVLRADENGRFVVTGGARRPSANDAPAAGVEGTNAPALKP